MELALKGGEADNDNNNLPNSPPIKWILTPEADWACVRKERCLFLLLFAVAIQDDLKMINGALWLKKKNAKTGWFLF